MRAGGNTPAGRKLIRLALQHEDNRASTLEDIIRARHIPEQEASLVQAFTDAAAAFEAVLAEKQAQIGHGKQPEREDMEDICRALMLFCDESEKLRSKALQAASVPKKRRSLPEKSCRRGKRGKAPNPDSVDVALPRDSPIGQKVENAAASLHISRPACLRLLLLHKTGIFISPQEQMMAMLSRYESCWARLRHFYEVCRQCGCAAGQDELQIWEMKAKICRAAGELKAGRLLHCA